MSKDIIQEHIDRSSRNQRILYSFGVLIHTLTCLTISVGLLAILSASFIDSIQINLALTLLSFITLLIVEWPSMGGKIMRKHLSISLDMEHPEAQTSPYSQISANSEWKEILQRNLTQSFSADFRRLKSRFFTFIFAIIGVVIINYQDPESLEKAFDQVHKAALNLRKEATLTITEGSKVPLTENIYKIESGVNYEFELLQQNLIKVRVIASDETTPILTLKDGRDPDSKILQSFRLISSSGPSSLGISEISLSIKDEAFLYLSTTDETKPFAHIKIDKPPLPKVTMDAIIDPSPDYIHHDDKPVKLKIETKSINPLRQLSLIINAEGKTSRQVVSNVLTNDKTEISTTYNIVLENYVQQDISEVELIAEAVDRSVPVGLKGFSNPVVIRTSSAYGRYRQTLLNLRTLKSTIDDSLEENTPLDEKTATESMEAAIDSAKDSPFFDGLDRMLMNNFKRSLSTFIEKKDFDILLELTESLNNFLFEHESLDDRERDRDFFVAARALSTLIEDKKSRSTDKIKAVTNSIKRFLDERQQRWKMRVEFLEPNKRPTMWPEVQQRPFAKALEEIQAIADKTDPMNQDLKQKTLAASVAKYGEWLEQLEENEATQVREREQQRREGLANARNQLKELQKTQGKISQRMDKSNTRKQEIEANWPSTKMMQKGNQEKAAAMEAQLRALSPRAGNRIKAASDAMKSAIQAGDEGNHQLAESAVDMAGRLLRQANSAAAQSQRQRGRRDRRRRITGDNYFGKQVVGGDVEIVRDYEVDERYRQLILDEIKGSQYNLEDDEKARLLEDYLKRIVR